MKYLFKDNTPFKNNDAQPVGEELERLRRENGNNLTQEAVVSAAKKKGSPLHDYFDWDDTEAAHKYRLYQARKLIGSIEIIRRGKHNRQIQVRAFVKVNKKGGAFDSTVEILSNEEKRALLVQQALDEAESWSTRYEDLVELAEIHGAIRKATKKRVAA